MWVKKIYRFEKESMWKEGLWRFEGINNSSFADLFVENVIACVSSYCRLDKSFSLYHLKMQPNRKGGEGEQIIWFLVLF